MAGTLSKATLEAIAAAVAAALASSVASSPVEPSAASSHFHARDLACTWPTPCAKTFRTVRGVAFHREQAKHAIGKA